MKYRKQIILGVIFIAFATVLSILFFTRNNKFSEYSYVELSPLDYSRKYLDIEKKDYHAKVFKIKTISSSSKQIVDSKNWVEWIEHGESKVFQELDEKTLSINDVEITSSYTNAQTWAYYIPKDDKDKIYLSYFLEGDNLLYIIEFENKES